MVAMGCAISTVRKLTACFVLCLAVTPAFADAYFDWLSGLPQVVIYRAYDNQNQINQDIYAIKPENRVRPPVYDAALNAARWTMTGASIAIGDQMRPSFPTISSGNVMFVWEARWESGFAGDLGGLDTHKAFQLSKTGSGDERRVEIRTRFSLASGQGVAKVDARGYIWNPSGQPLPGQINDFTIQAETWTRFWAFVDFSNRQLSLWVADEHTNPVQLFNKLQYSSMSGGLDNFWFEFNSSQTRSGGALNIWARNFAVLKNVANAQDIVNQSGDPQATLQPKAPLNLAAQ